MEVVRNYHSKRKGTKTKRQSGHNIDIEETCLCFFQKRWCSVSAAGERLTEHRSDEQLRLSRPLDMEIVSLLLLVLWLLLQSC